MTQQDLTFTSTPAEQPAQQGGGCGCGCSTSSGARAEVSGEPAAGAVQNSPAEQALSEGEAGERGAPGGEVTARYGVVGMTCGHCVSAVTEELSALPRVIGVQVALVAGGTSTVTLTSTARLDDEVVRAAVDEAGYEVVSA